MSFFAESKATAQTRHGDDRCRARHRVDRVATGRTLVGRNEQHVDGLKAEREKLPKEKQYFAG